ncbi:MAG: dynamin family protein [Clostridia bacterium]|nr:dynamin family protein [Clostridia bacterium]
MISEKQTQLKLKLKNELNSRIKFYDDIAKNYPVDSDEFEEYREFYERLKSKISDEKINFTVIGEFSTGKSTFINALLKSRFLESKVLQGTTSAATVIESGDKYRAVLEYNDLTKNVLTFKDAYEMKSVVDEFTVNSENTQKIKKVTFQIPDIALDSRMRIIDTPGTNVEYKWHEDVTRYSISRISDVSIVLIDATKVLPESLIDFIEENIKDRIEYTIFVVTKIDCVKEKEIEGILKYVKIKLMQEFELSKTPIVLPYAALQVLEYATEKKSCVPNEHEKKLLAISKKTEVAFERFFDANHLSYLAKSFKHNESLVRFELKNSLEAHKKRLYDSVHLDDEKIKRSKNFMPEFFKNDQSRWRIKSFNQSSGKIHADLSNRMQRVKSNLLSRINFEIHNNQFVKKNTGVALKNHFTDFFMTQTQILTDECQRFFDLLKGKYVYEMCSFLKLYQTTCNNISILPPRVYRKKYCDYINNPNPINGSHIYDASIEKEMTKIFTGSYSNSLIKNSFAPGIRARSNEVLDFAQSHYAHVVSDIMSKMEKQIESTKELMLNQFEWIVRDHMDYIEEQVGNLTYRLMEYEEKRELIDTDITVLKMRK